VDKFYSFWSVFATRKQFSSHDKYKPSTAPNRQIRRLMEKENKKERDKHRRTFNDQVRHLVSFVSKLDKRVLEHKRKLALEKEEKAKVEEERKRKEAQYVPSFFFLPSTFSSPSILRSISSSGSRSPSS
jgi:DnaJ family protein A protein 5